MSSNIKTFGFAIILCFTVSFGLTFAAEGLKDRQKLNQKVDKQKNVLKALGLIESDKKYSPEGKELTEIILLLLIVFWHPDVFWITKLGI